MSRLLLAAIWSLLLVAVLATSNIKPPFLEGKPLVAKKPDQEVLHDHVGTKGGVSSESKACSTWGKQIMEEGGNAVDAAIATTLCVGTVAPYHSGIGGGGFMIVRDKEGNYEAIDFRETAPANASENMYQGNLDGSVYGGLAVGVPGEIRGLWYAHQKYGSLPWKRLFEGAYYKARGTSLNQDYSNYINRAISGTDGNFLVEDPSWALDYVKDGKLVGEGQNVERTRYAKTLETIAKNGADAFYTGKIAKAMVKAIQKRNGTITLADFENYEVKTRPVLTTTHRGYKLHTIGAPASGAVSLNMLNVLEQFAMPRYTYSSHDEHHKSYWTPFTRVGYKEKTSPEAHDAYKEHTYDKYGMRDGLWHVFVETMRFAYAGRGKLGDPGFVRDVEDYQSKMVDKENAKRIKKLINPKRTQNITAYDPGNVYQPEDHGTSHIATADNSGMAVSLTSTVNLLFGSRVLCEETGVIFNNQMNDFSIPGTPNEFHFQPSESNYIRPGKRPLSSITPIIVERKDGTFFATIGAAGGSRIISSTTQVLWRILSESASIGDAIAEARLHDQLMPNELLVERHFPPTSARVLERKFGHNVTWVEPGMSIVEGVTLDKEGFFDAGADRRQKEHGGVVV